MTGAAAWRSSTTGTSRSVASLATVLIGALFVQPFEQIEVAAAKKNHPRQRILAIRGRKCIWIRTVTEISTSASR
jgi:hypothetical protein